MNLPKAYIVYDNPPKEKQLKHILIKYNSWCHSLKCLSNEAILPTWPAIRVKLCYSMLLPEVVSHVSSRGITNVGCSLAVRT